MTRTEHKWALFPMILAFTGGLVVLLWIFGAIETFGVELKGIVGYDSYMSEFFPTQNSGSATTGLWGGGAANDEYHPWFEDTLIHDVPASSTIDSVKLKIYFTSTYSNSEVTCTLWVSAKDATEAGITWNKYDGTNNWTTAGGDKDTIGGGTNTIATFVTNCGWGGACYVTVKLNSNGTIYFQQLLDGRVNYGMIGHQIFTAKKEFHSSEGTNPDSIKIYYTAGAADVYSGKQPRGIGRGIIR